MKTNKSFSSNITAKEKALRLLDRFDYSEKGLYDKLCEKFPPREAAEAVAYCVEKNYVNDYRYGIILRDRYNQKYGTRRVYFELIKRGIPKDKAAQIIEEDLPEKEESVQKIIGLIAKKQKNRPVDQEDKKRIIAFLVRRGFNLDLIYSAIEMYNEELLK